MADFTGQLQGFASALGASPPRRVLLDAVKGDAILGGNGAGGDVRVLDSDNVVRVRIDGTGAEPGPPTAEGIAAAVVISGNGSLRAGGASTEGSVTLLNAQGNPCVQLKASDQGTLSGAWLGGAGRQGVVVLRDAAGVARASLTAESGRLHLHDEKGNLVLQLVAQEPGALAGAWCGGAGRSGVVVVRDAAGVARASLNAQNGRLHLHDEKGNLVVQLVAQEAGARAGAWLGGNSRDGLAVVRNKAGRDRVVLDGKDGEVRVCTGDGDTTIRLSGNGASGWFGGHGQAGDLLLFAANVDTPSTDNASIWLQGENGDIVLRNADCAEEFTVRPDPAIGPGAVLVLDDDGRLVPCHEAYDSRVAGVVSGADGIRPGIVLGRVPGAGDRWPIALAGKVMCNVDASFGPVRTGSLLTTSPRPGFAMAASDRGRAFGAVIGKAMAPLEADSGRVPILVCLQ